MKMKRKYAVDLMDIHYLVNNPKNQKGKSVDR